MLMAVVTVFFLCNVLALIVNILELQSINLTALNNFSNMLVTLNSSVNFIIYCIFGEKFKRIFLQMFCRMSAASNPLGGGSGANMGGGGGAATGAGSNADFCLKR